MERITSKKPFRLYVFLSYLITWGCWIPTLLIMVAKGYPVPSFLTFVEIFETGYQSPEQWVVSLIFQFGTFGPMISGIICLAVFQPKNGLKDLWNSAKRWDFPRFWYGVIFLIPIGTGVISYFIGGLETGTWMPFYFTQIPWFYGILVLINQTFTSGLEEIGWRGFATPEMQKWQNAEDTGFYIGIIWAIWHFPFLVYLYSGGGPINLAIILPSLIGYVFLVIPMAILNVWIYNNTKSVGLLVLGHGLNNTIPWLLSGGVNTSFAGFAVAAFSWILVAIVTKKYGKATLTISPPKQDSLPSDIDTK